jgi:hypothetical protein
MRHARLAAVVGCWLAALAIVQAAGDIIVTPLVTDGRVMASFAAGSTFDEDARELLKSGLPVTFAYAVELRNPSLLWFDGTLARVDVSASAKYDTLTDTYQVSKLRGEQVFWSESTRDQGQAGEWMTAFDRIPLEPSDALEPNRDYYVQVRLRRRPQRRFSFWPWGGDDATGRADFTYLR